MKNRKKLALLAFATSMAVLSWVYPHEEVKAYPPGFRAQSKPCEIGGVVVSHGAVVFQAECIALRIHAHLRQITNNRITNMLALYCKELTYLKLNKTNSSCS